MRPRIAQLLVAIAAMLAFVADPSTLSAQLSEDAKFVKAVKDGDMREVQVWVVNGGNVNARDANGVPAIVIAAEQGMASLVKYLVDNGANPGAESRQTGETALMYAAATGDARVIRLLAAKGADVDAVDRGGETALIKAAREGSRSAARALIEAGADYEIEDYTGRTALQIARESRRQTVADVLISAGATY